MTITSVPLPQPGNKPVACSSCGASPDRQQRLRPAGFFTFIRYSPALMVPLALTTVVKQQIPIMKRKTDNFNKFFNKKRNSAIKEQFKQEKKAAKKERKESIERHFEDKRQAPWANQPHTEQNSKPGSPKKGAPAQGNAPAGKAGPRSFRPAHAPAFGARGKNAAPGASAAQDPNLIPLNKYIAHGGICSRRDTAQMTKLGQVLVNGRPVTEPGTKVSPANDLV